jgi:endonuclease G
VSQKTIPNALKDNKFYLSNQIQLSMKTAISILHLLLLSMTIFAQTITVNPEQLAIPQCPECDQIVTHTGFTIGYEKDYRQARFVAYVLTESETRAIYERTNNFRSDPKLSFSQAGHSNYKGSGYDRGHLAPAGDMAWSPTTMSESFYYSNMSPQEPGFNRGIWKKLEDQVRGWAVENGSVIVITGCVFNSFKGYIGGGLPVPSQYYKVLLDFSEPEVKAIAFVLPNQKSSASLSTYAYSVDYVESITGLDFFYQLPDALEAELEGSYDISMWPFTGFSSSGGSVGVPAEQCKGVTQAGLRCKNKTKNANGYCHVHQSQAEGGNKSIEKAPRRAESVQCSGTTKSGARCKRMTKSPNGRCWQHGGN